MQEWGIPKEKILTAITNNGSNTVAAFKPISAGDETSAEEDESLSGTSELDELW